MSVEAISLVLNHSRAEGTAKLVLVGIANHAGDGGSWPTIATLARYANTSERSVQRSISRLVELGEVVVRANAGGTRETPNDRRPNRYDITLKPVDKAVQPASDGVTQMSPRDVDGVTLVTERGDAGVANGVTPVSPEPSLNHPRTIPSSSRPTNTDLDARFGEFWDAYGRKVGRGAALKAWRAALRRGADPEHVIAAAATFRFQVVRDGRAAEFVAHPASWLNAERYDDEPPTTPATDTAHRHARLVEQAPDGLTDAEYAAWERDQLLNRRRHG